LNFTKRAVIEVTGACRLGGSARPVYVKVNDPSLYAGAALRNALENASVPVRGELRRGSIPGDSLDRTLVHVHESRRLLDLLSDLNKFSSNFVSEHVLRAMGAERFGPPGSREKGIEAVREFLCDADVERGTYCLVDGCGLSRENHVPARAFVRVLALMHGDPALQPEYLSTLALPAGEGTLEERFQEEEFQGRMRAKTGSMRGVSSLSGYVRAESGADLVFCLIVNEYGGSADRMERVQEDVVRALLSIRP
jgi:D-alanyl-D-alanine carboxypeptidase/D-alanyl-D-alanine-endopeptidase (penicillin-binding protein 4)